MLGVALVCFCIWFFLPKSQPTVVEKPVVVVPDTRLAEYIKGKRFTWLLPKESVPEQLRETAIGQQIASQPVFVQFNTNNVVQFGTMMNGRAVAMEKGTYTSEDLTITLNKSGGTDTAVATKAEPAEGDELSVTDAQGKEINLSIMKVEPAAPLQTAGAAALAGLGLGGGTGAMPAGSLEALAGLLPTAGSTSSGKGEVKGDKDTGGGYPQSNTTGQRTEWTFGVGSKDLAKWKGQSARNVIGVFGQPDVAKSTPDGGGEWQYNNVKITDAQGKLHRTVTFSVMNGNVEFVRLRPALPK